MAIVGLPTTITDVNGNVIFPLTHESQVRFDDGENLDDKILRVAEVEGFATAAEASKDISIAQAGLASTSATNSEASAVRSRASEVAAKLAESNTKISELTVEEYKGIVQQAMTDYLAMIGVDIATLTDGKLTPSQIPNISINDTFNVADVSEIVELVAERGDVAIVVAEDVVTDSYILATDDPTDMSNWKKLGVSWVANAGHAETATSAENSDMINNHRLITMTQEQYDLAVLEPETIYLVG